MPTRSNSFIASPALRLELAPSRWLARALVAIGLAAGAGMLLTNLPLAPAIVAGALCTGWGFVLARRTARGSTSQLVLHADGRVQLDGRALDDVRIHWQGPLTCLRWVDGGRCVRMVAWPDVVRGPARRELRLWALARPADATPAPVAP